MEAPSLEQGLVATLTIQQPSFGPSSPSPYLTVPTATTFLRQRTLAPSHPPSTATFSLSLVIEDAKYERLALVLKLNSSVRHESDLERVSEVRVLRACVCGSKLTGLAASTFLAQLSPVLKATFLATPPPSPPQADETPSTCPHPLHLPYSSNPTRHTTFLSLHPTHHSISSSS